MYNNYTDSLQPDNFGLKMLLFIGGMFVILVLVNLFLRKVLGVEKRNIFKAQYVNDRHKKMEFYLSMAGLVLVVAVTIYGYGKSAMYPIYATLACLLIATLYRAYMEKKHAEEPREFLFTLLEYPLMVLLLLSWGSFLFPDIPLY